MPALTLFRTSAAAAGLLTAAVSGLWFGAADSEPAETPLTFAVGELLQPQDVHLIERNGFYGLGADLPGTRYAIAGGHLIRVDAESLRVQSILREETRLPD